MLVFLDFEASSLSPNSYPVEVGWVAETGEGEGHLIRPAMGWEEWSLESEKIHGLSRGLLEKEGEAVEDVAHRLFDILGAEGVVVVSDAARWEQMWLDRLMDAARVVHSIQVVELEKAILVPESRRILSLAPPEGTPGYHLARGALLDQASEIIGGARHAEGNRRRVRHRAFQDADGMRWWWAEVRERVNEALEDGFGERLLARKGSVPKGILG